MVDDLLECELKQSFNQVLFFKFCTKESVKENNNDSLLILLKKLTTVSSSFL